MHYIIVGTNHKHSPIEIRERISFSKRSAQNALGFLKENPAVKSAVILSTCNRVELHASVCDREKGMREIEGFISFYHEIDKSEISPYLYMYKDIEALRHLFSVTSGLDSLILGETQIAGQARSAFTVSREGGFTDEILEKAFNSAISVANKVHRETKISELKVSAGSVAIDFIKERIGKLSDKNILIIGTGKVTELVLRHLKIERPNVIFVSNRTYEKAKNFAHDVGGRAVRFEALKKHLARADVIISATRSPSFIIRKKTLEEAISYKQSAISRKILIIDLALPRDVEPEVKELKNTELFCLEDLDTIIKKNIEKKNREKELAEAIIDIEVKRAWREITELEREKARLP